MGGNRMIRLFPSLLSTVIMDGRFFFELFHGKGSSRWRFTVKIPLLHLPVSLDVCVHPLFG
ncbi:hypothetical protein AERO8C_20471 [Aeromonas veronii]|uniref:Uncharacterized protein n=1 Tax=Aeromonas veronii TaxID=654 RepID=A0A653L1U2_AERVE|nr:hypothetical protein AERO8C_20471 [Aeromonas veronii]